MIVGVVRDHLPRITITFHGPTGPQDIELIVDTGFDGDFVLPFHLIRSLDLPYVYLSRRRLGDGTIRECSIHEVQVSLNGDLKTAEVIRFEHDPLIGKVVLDGWLLTAHLSNGGEVVLEPPE